ncbi:MAG: GSU2403 family nucleotidyltransferase fold protein [Planctomycetota bacterium]
MRITLPHPANFALHKLIISQRRTQKDKASKDIETARIILQALIDKGDKGVIKKVFDGIPQKWQKKIIRGLKKIEQKEVLEIIGKQS